MYPNAHTTTQTHTHVRVLSVCVSALSFFFPSRFSFPPLKCIYTEGLVHTSRRDEKAERRERKGGEASRENHRHRRRQSFTAHARATPNAPRNGGDSTEGTDTKCEWSGDGKGGGGRDALTLSEIKPLGRWRRQRKSGIVPKRAGRAADEGWKEVKGMCAARVRVFFLRARRRLLGFSRRRRNRVTRSRRSRRRSKPTPPTSFAAKVRQKTSCRYGPLQRANDGCILAVLLNFFLCCCH